MFFLSHFKTQGLPLFQRPQLLICPDTERAENIFQSLARNFPGEVLHFPGLEVSPYGGAVPSHDNVHRQFYAMSKIALWPDVPWIIVTTVEAALLKIPPPDFFADKKLTTLTKGEGPDPQTLGERLVALGYFSSHRAMEPGTFCRKGEIFDVYPLAEDPVRIHYFDDTIEDIFAIDSRDYTTLKEKPRQRVLLSSAPLALASEPHSRSLRGQVALLRPRPKGAL